MASECVAGEGCNAGDARGYKGKAAMAGGEDQGGGGRRRRRRRSLKRRRRLACWEPPRLALGTPARAGRSATGAAGPGPGPGGPRSVALSPRLSESP